MHSIAKITSIENELYYVKINQFINVKKDFYNHILIIDNMQIKKDISYLINEYPFLLTKYYNNVNLKNIYIITTFPKIKVTILKISEIYTEFRKIYHNNSKLIELNDHFFEIFDECNKLIKLISEENIFNEIIIFTHFDYAISEESKISLNEIMKFDKTTISIICNDDFVNIPNINMFLSLDFEGENELFLKNIINNGIFLQNPLLINNLNIILDESTIYGTDINNFILDSNSHNIIIIENKINKILINDEYCQLQDIIFKEEDLLEGIELLLNISETQILNKKNYFVLKKLISNQMNNLLNIEIKNKSIILYGKLKKLLNKLIEKEISKIDSKNENKKILIEYGKKSKIMNNNKINFIINNRIIKNVKNFEKWISYNELENEKIKNFIKIHENSDNNIFLESCEFFNSSITLSNWYDELKNDSGLGLLLKISSNDLSKIGFGNNTIINNITSTYLSILDFIVIATNFFDKNNDIDFGNLNLFDMIEETTLGNANAIIPLYINKYHWNVVKKYVDPLLGIIISHNPLSYSNSHKSFFFAVFMEMTKELFDEDKKMLNENFVKIYIALLRTCAEICFENKYNYGIKKLLNLYLNDGIIRICNDKNPYDKICAQVLSTGFIINNNQIEILIIYFIEEIIRLYIKKNQYDSNYIDFLLTLEDISLDDEFDILIQNMCDKNNYDWNMLSSFFKMNQILEEVFNKYGSYSKFIKLLENNYGIFDNQGCNILLENINKNLNQNEYFLENLYNLINVHYNKYNLIFYVLQSIKQSSNKSRKEAILNNKYINILGKQLDKEYILQYLKNWHES